MHTIIIITVMYVTISTRINAFSTASGFVKSTNTKETHRAIPEVKDAYFCHGSSE